jgi:hypothetical protein
MRADAPLLIETADLRISKLFAMSAINSLFAFPSTGGDLTRASQMPPPISSRLEDLALGLTLTWIVFIALRAEEHGGGRPRTGRAQRRPAEMRIVATQALPFTNQGGYGRLAAPAGRVVELADTRDLGSRGAIRAGSTPVAPTIF